MSIDVSNVKETLRQFIVDEYLPGESIDESPGRHAAADERRARFDGDAGLVSFVEKEFGIELEAHETGIENFDTIGDIAALVVQKRARTLADRRP